VINRNKIGIDLMDIIDSEYVKNRQWEGNKTKNVNISQDRIMNNIEVIPKGPVNTDMREICFEDIDENFSYGNYADFKVIVMKKNGYINAPKMCAFIREQEGITKKFCDWGSNKEAIALKQAVSRTRQISVDETCIIIGNTFANHIRGTYVHPTLVPHIASWMSPDFGVKVSDIINEFLIKQNNTKNLALVNELNITIDNQNNKIVMQNDKIYNHENTIIKLNKKIDTIVNNTNILIENDKETKSTLARICDRNDIQPGHPNKISVFILWKNNIKPGKGRKQYYVMKFTKKSENELTRTYKRKYPNGEILLRISDNPHARNLWYRVDKELSENSRRIIHKKGCEFNISKYYTETLLVKDIRNLHRERLDTNLN
jgi:hypothetical protein